MMKQDPVRSCGKAVELIREGRAEILMKGLVPTAPLLSAVLDNEKGLKKRNVLSHLAIFQTRYYHKLIGVTDAAMNIEPGISEKVKHHPECSRGIFRARYPSTKGSSVGAARNSQ